MKKIEIIGYKRANLGKSEAKKLRSKANVPCVLYGGDKQIHFHSPMALFNELIYTKDAHFIHLNIEGEIFSAILQDVQFHPVSEIILHADFLQLFEKKKIIMNIPIKLIDQSPAVAGGGILVHKRRMLRILSLPQYMPSHIDVSIANLQFNQAVKVQEIKTNNYTILDSKIASIAVVEVPRSLKTLEEGDEDTETVDEEKTTESSKSEKKEA